MKIFLFGILFLLLSKINYSLLFPSISLKIINDTNLLDEIDLDFTFYMKYNEIISQQEFSPVYKIIYVSKDTPDLKEKKTKNILLFDSFSTFFERRECNISNFIIFPKKYTSVLNKELLYYFDCKQYIFFVEQEQFNVLKSYEAFSDAKIVIPEEISKNFLKSKQVAAIPQYYFILMLLSFIVFFFYLFHYNFLVPLLYKDFWLFFISQFYLFIPLRFILLVLLSIKLIIIQNQRGILPSAPGFFIILAVQKSLIKTNIITIILLANEGLYIFENMKKIIKKMTIYKLQFFFVTVFLILLLSFPLHIIIMILDSILFPFIFIHAFINYQKLKKTLKIACLTNRRYIPFIKLKIKIWIKQNILLSIYFISLIIIYIYSNYSTNKILVDEIICLKADMLEYCAENIFLFAFCYLYRPRQLERNFFIVYTEKLNFFNLKFYMAEINQNNNIKNKIIAKNEKEINKKSISIFRKENFNKPIIVLNPSYIMRSKNNPEDDNNSHEENKLYNSDKLTISIGRLK